MIYRLPTWPLPSLQITNAMDSTLKCRIHFYSSSPTWIKINWHVSSVDKTFLHSDWWMPVSHHCKALSYCSFLQIFHSNGDFQFSLLTGDFLDDSPTKALYLLGHMQTSVHTVRAHVALKWPFSVYNYAKLTGFQVLVLQCIWCLSHSFSTFLTILYVHARLSDLMGFHEDCL